jgi:hypothetical protein
MRLRNRSHYQTVKAVELLLSFNHGFRCTVWRDTEWTYLDVQPSPQGDDYVALTKWAELAGIRLDRMSGPFPLRRYELRLRLHGEMLHSKPGSLLVTTLEMERCGATERDVNRVADLQAGETFEPTDKAFTVRRVL